MKHVSERFLEYAAFDSQSDHDSETTPSSAKQLELAKFLAKECEEIGLSDVRMSEFGYVYASLPGNTDKKVPVIGFVAHMDTSPDASGKNIHPRIIKNYDGKDIRLSESLTMTAEEFPSLLDNVGQDIIVTDGTTLLGADDKAGIAEIISAAEHLINHPEIKHGDIKIAFTPDEEIGRGTDKFDVEDFGADFAYTLDGGKLGELEYETFNAADAKITIKGKSVHPGSAKGVMVNSLLLAAELAGELPITETPQNTEGREGFYHITSLNGNCEESVMRIIIRDHDGESFNRRKDFLLSLILRLNRKHGERFILNLTDSYRNMREVLENRTDIIDLARAAMAELDITPITIPVRGGTDGARLSFMGLPCPNLFTGGYNAHGPYEYVSINAMEKAVELVAKIAELAVR